MSVLLALTGSIGMGKSTAAKLFANAGCPVWDADASVHRLYAGGNAGAQALKPIAPSAVSEQGVERAELRRLIAEDDTLLKKIEGAIHPLVTQDRAHFIATHSEPVLVFDIPLLFETKAEAAFDAVAVVSTDPNTQRTRVLARPGMTPETFELILSKQIPDADKRARADFIIDSTTMETAQADVSRILTSLGKGHDHA